MSEPRTIVLGVAGGSGSGKTAVARALLDAVGRDRIAFLALDSYYRDIVWNSRDEIVEQQFRPS